MTPLTTAQITKLARNRKGLYLTLDQAVAKGIARRGTLIRLRSAGTLCPDAVLRVNHRGRPAHLYRASTLKAALTA